MVVDALRGDDETLKDHLELTVKVFRGQQYWKRGFWENHSYSQKLSICSVLVNG